MGHDQVHSPTVPIKHLALYHYEGCGFCARVRRTADEMNVDLELRDIHRGEEHFDDLRAARGRTTVPVLRIAYEDGNETWLPESRDIIAFLTANFRI